MRKFFNNNKFKMKKMKKKTKKNINFNSNQESLLFGRVDQFKFKHLKSIFFLYFFAFYSQYNLLTIIKTKGR